MFFWKKYFRKEDNSVSSTRETELLSLDQSDVSLSVSKCGLNLANLIGYRLLGLIAILVVSTVSANAYFEYSRVNIWNYLGDKYYLLLGVKDQDLLLGLDKTRSPKKDQTTELVPVIVDAPPIREAAEKIISKPPKQQVAAKAVSNVTNTDGSTTTVVAEGDVSQVELTRINSLPAGASTPAELRFTDKTGVYSGLEPILKDYLAATLRWSNEISFLKEIMIDDVSGVSWSGQYNASYTISSSGDISSAFGWITLNVSAYKELDEFYDYMKWVLAHEYGHHYTLYHKWVDADLPIGVRFPESYYTIRPLDMGTTVVDCSGSWNNCESEIVAEDYAYLYSGYNYHAMADQFGYPSSGTKSWLDDIANSLKTNSDNFVPPPRVNLPPTISITSPTSSDQINDSFTFSVSANDDQGVSKVIFYRDTTILVEDDSSPYDVAVSLAGLTTGQYQFKAVAEDGDGARTEAYFTLAITQPEAPSSDVTLPQVILNEPTQNPYNWQNGPLAISAEGSDNTAVVLMEVYIDGKRKARVRSNAIGYTWNYESVEVGSHDVVIKAYDSSANVGELSFTVTKIDSDQI